MKVLLRFEIQEAYMKANSYRFIDRRKWIRNEKTMLTPNLPAQFSGAMAIPGSAEVEKRFDLDQIKYMWLEFLNHHSAAAEAKKWMDQFKPELAKLVKQATILTVGDRPVATYDWIDKLNQKQLADERPDIIAKYTRIKAAEVFDTEWFKQEDPETYNKYRVRSLKLTN